MITIKSHIDTNGRLAIPAKIRKKLKLNHGDEVSIKYNDSELIISTYHSNLNKARSILNKYPDINLTDELKLLRAQDDSK